MTSKEFRAAVFQMFVDWQAASYPALPIIYENGPVPDEESIGPIWLDVEIRWLGSSISTLGAQPRTRLTGNISAMCYHRQASGTDEPDSIVDSLATLFQAKRIGAAVTDAAQRSVPTFFNGWYKTGIYIPFILD